MSSDDNLKPLNHSSQQILYFEEDLVINGDLNIRELLETVTNRDEGVYPETIYVKGNLTVKGNIYNGDVTLLYVGGNLITHSISNNDDTFEIIIDGDLTVKNLLNNLGETPISIGGETKTILYFNKERLDEDDLNSNTYYFYSDDYLEAWSESFEDILFEISDDFEGDENIFEFIKIHWNEDAIKQMWSSQQFLAYDFVEKFIEDENNPQGEELEALLAYIKVLLSNPPSDELIEELE